MSMEVIKEIKSIEGIAEDKIKAAYQQAKDIILQAEGEAEEVIKNAVNEEIAKGNKLVEDAEKDANTQLEVKRQLNQKLCEEIREKANAKLEEAVKMVMERIVSINGNS
ncbi:MAG: synthase [Clostridia bacterium]|nr:synthase [Clostridia bacterium]